jgi:RNA polymerase-binding transcription factor DksA
MREGSSPSTPTAPTIPAVDESPDPRAEREAELAVLDRIQGEMADVDRALARLDEGGYGTCEVCGEAIADEVLETAPATRLCPEHEASAALAAPVVPAAPVETPTEAPTATGPADPGPA